MRGLKMRSLLVAFALVVCIIASTAAWAADIMEVAAKNPNLSMFVSAVKSAGLTNTLNSAGPFTIFAPSNAAFKKIPAATLRNLMKPENKARLASILSYHAIKGRVTSADARKMKSPVSVATLGGADLKISREGNMIHVNNAMITSTDIKADNGVIHIIDMVLMPRRATTSGAGPQRHNNQ